MVLELHIHTCHLPPSGNPTLKKGGRTWGGSTIIIPMKGNSARFWLAGCGFDLASCFPQHAVPPVVLLLAQYFENTLNQGFLTEKVGVACTTPVLTPSPHPVHRPRRGAIIGGRGAKRLPLSFVAQEAASSLPI